MKKLHDIIENILQNGINSKYVKKYNFSLYDIKSLVNIFNELNTNKHAMLFNSNLLKILKTINNITINDKIFYYNVFIGE